MDSLPPTLAALAGGRFDVVTRGELHTHGVTDARIHWAVARGRWQLLVPGVVLLGPSPADRRQQLIAALLLGGPGAVIAGPAAARFHGVQGIPSTGAVHVLVPRSRARRRHAWADIRPTRLDDPRRVETELLRYSSVARSVVDAACWAPSQDAATAWVLEAVQRRIVEIDDVAAWVHRLNRRWSAKARRALAEAERGAWSLPEAELLELLATSRTLPGPWANPVLVDSSGSPLVTPDAWFDDVGLAVMVHSREYHEGPGQWDRTVSQDGELTAAGVVVVGVTPHAIRTTGSVVLDRVERAHRVAAGRPRPPVVATRRGQRS